MLAASHVNYCCWKCQCNPCLEVPCLTAPPWLRHLMWDSRIVSKVRQPRIRGGKSGKYTNRFLSDDGKHRWCPLHGRPVASVFPSRTMNMSSVAVHLPILRLHQFTNNDQGQDRVSTRLRQQRLRQNSFFFYVSCSRLQISLEYGNDVWETTFFNEKRLPI